MVLGTYISCNIREKCVLKCRINFVYMQKIVRQSANVDLFTVNRDFMLESPSSVSIPNVYRLIM